MNEGPRNLPGIRAATAAGRDQAHRGPAETITIESIAEHWPYIEAVAHRTLGPGLASKSDASDLAQQTCLEAYQDFHKFSGTTDAQLKSWLRQIVINNVRGLAQRFRSSSSRDISREVSLERFRCEAGDIEQPTGWQSSPERAAVREEEIGRLRKAMDRLPSPLRKVLVLRHFENMSFKSIGDCIGCSPVAARKAWLRALAATRRDFQ